MAIIATIITARFCFIKEREISKQRPQVVGKIRKLSAYNLFEINNKGNYKPIFRVLLELTNMGREATTIKNIQIILNYKFIPGYQISSIRFISEYSDENKSLSIPFLFDLLPGQSRLFYLTFVVNPGLSKLYLEEYEKKISNVDFNEFISSLLIEIYDGQNNRFVSRELKDTQKLPGITLRIKDNAVGIDKSSGFCWINERENVPFNQIKTDSTDFINILFDDRFNIYDPKKEKKNNN